MVRPAAQHLVSTLIYFRPASQSRANRALYTAEDDEDGVTAVSGAATGTGAAAAATSTDWLSSLAAFNNVTLTAPALPSSMPSTAFTIQAMNSAQDVQGLSIQQGADFFGFSIEMSVVTQVSEYHVVGGCVWLVRGMRDLTRDRLRLGLGSAGVQSARTRTS